MKKWMLASRTLSRRPAFALAAILILALGIGANTAMFAMVDAILLKPLPYPNANRLVTVLEASDARNQKESLIAPVRLEEWNRMNRTFDAIAGIYAESVTDTSGAEPERLDGRRVSPRYFDVFRTRPILGRTFTPQEDLFGGPAAVIISEPFWSRRYHSDPHVIGKRLIVGNAGFTIVGVMPRQFASPKIDVWLPAQLAPFLMTQVRDARFYSGAGLLKPGVSRAQAQEDLDRVERELGRQYPRTDAGWSALVGNLKEFRVGEYRKTLYFVFSALGLLLLIAVANIAGLMLSQLYRRGKELAIRSSIGGTRAQVVGSVLREVALIAAAGVALGCLLAFWLAGFESTAFSLLPRASEIRVDWRAVLFAGAAGAFTALLCGLLPALQATRSDVSALLAEGGRSETGGRHRWQSVLVGSQIALTLLLLASAGLMLRSYHNISQINPGFDAEHAVTFHVGAAWDEDRKRIGQTQIDLLDKLQHYPGVEAAGFANFLPASGATLRYQVTVEGLAGAGDGGRITVGERSITGGYLQAMGDRILEGQSCPDLRAVSSGPAKAIVSRRFADLYAGGPNLVGRHLRWAGAVTTGEPMEIAGIAGNMQEDTLTVTPAPYVYFCITPGGWPDPEYVVRTHGDPRALEQAIRPLVHSVAPSRAVFGMQTLQEYLDATMDQPRMNTRMLSWFAGAALLLASIGLYSLVSLTVTSRTREIGVRMTLGAQPGQIVRELAVRIARLLAAGVAAGIILLFFADRLLRSVLFGVSPLDFPTLGATVLLLAIVAGIATVVPARRAARIDPLQAMK